MPHSLGLRWFPHSPENCDLCGERVLPSGSRQSLGSRPSPESSRSESIRSTRPERVWLVSECAPSPLGFRQNLLGSSLLRVL